MAAGDPRSTAAHQRRRAELLPAAHYSPCPRCGLLMLPDEALDLGHSTDLVDQPGRIGDRIEHASCNRSAGALRSGSTTRLQASRRWL